MLFHILISLLRFYLKTCSHLGIKRHPHNNHSYLCVTVLCLKKKVTYFLLKIRIPWASLFRTIPLFIPGVMGLVMIVPFL